MWPFIPGEMFPYSNFHAMNQDWIIAVVKDFLNKYTTIDNKINTGVQTIQTTATQELARILADLTTWYNNHQNYLDQE